VVLPWKEFLVEVPAEVPSVGLSDLAEGDIEKNMSDSTPDYRVDNMDEGEEEEGDKGEDKDEVEDR
jgi:hypothetical protein